MIFCLVIWGILTLKSASSLIPATEEHAGLRNKFVQLEKQLSDLRNAVQKEAEQILSYNRRIASLERAWFFARSRVAIQCIQHRNELSSAAIRSDYEATLREMGRQPDKHLQVFPVSASVHLVYQTSKKRHFGFPNREDTQISALRDWLLGATLDDRQRYAQAFLDNIDAFLSSIEVWIADNHGESKISADLRGNWEPQLERLVGELEAVRHLI
jgi:hypothetical protein